MEELLIKGGEVIDPWSGLHDRMDIYIQNGKIAKIAKSIDVKAASVLDASGRVVGPGLFDLHAHLCDPGFTRREDIRSGSRSAAAGGFTTVVTMPNTEPVIDNPTIVYYVLAKARETACIRVLPAASVTKGMKGAEISPIGSLKASGAVLLSNDEHPILEAEILRRAMSFNRGFGLPFSLHCEEPSLSKGGLVREGNTSVRFGVKGIPDIAETTMMSRDILIAGATGTKLHINHIGSKSAVDVVKTAKHRGTHVTCDVTPFHFFFTDTEIADFDPNFKFIPPIGNQEDVQAIKQGLKDGTIDIITSDHIPWTAEEKNVDFDQAPFGSIGLETVFGMSYTALVLPGVLTVAELLKKMTMNPAKVLGLSLSRLEVGAEADLCVLDLKASWVVEPKNFQSLASNTPMKGKTLQGKPVATVVKGEIVMKEGIIQENVFPFRG